MEKRKKYRGVFTPMVTPFTKTGKLDEEAACKIIDHLLQGGAYPFLLGTTGEGASIPLETRLRLVRVITDYADGKTAIFAGISDNCLDNSLNLAKDFYERGVDVFVAHLPSYYPLTTGQMLKYYLDLADKSPGPIMIYNIPATTQKSIPLEIVEKLSQHPNIVGIKDSERDLNRLESLSRMFGNRQDFSIMCGWTNQSAHCLLLGFDGIVPNAANLAPKLFKQLFDAANSTQTEDVNKLQQQADAVTEIFQSKKVLSKIIAGLKVAMSELGLCQPWVLPPFTNLSKQQEEEIRLSVHKLGIDKSFEQ
ncbi:MAG: dihydrodipicolinate synthase family protein [Calditrichaeota bacterium]|nr:dihydrodipicolinate synthase family protein [Calditrichota bacterium]